MLEIIGKMVKRMRLAENRLENVWKYYPCLKNIVLKITTKEIIVRLGFLKKLINLEELKILPKAQTLGSEVIQIGVEGAKFLSQNSTITTLILWDNKIGDEGAKYLSQNSTITTLNLGDNNIGVEGAKFLSQNSTITTLDLRSNKISVSE